MAPLTSRASRCLCLCALAGLTALGGCAALVPGASVKPALDTSIDRELTGRISVHYRSFSTNHEETVFANFDWTERGPDVDLDLLNPLGQTIAKVRSAPDRSTITLSDGRVYSGATPEALTTEVLGWTLPVGGLKAWLEGRAAHPDTPAATVDADGSHRLVESGWTIVYPEVDREGAPARLNLTYPGPGVALDLRIVVDTRSGA